MEQGKINTHRRLRATRLMKMTMDEEDEGNESWGTEYEDGIGCERIRRRMR